MALEYRWADNRYERLPALAEDLVSRKVDVIVTSGGTPSALAAKGATSTIPIVFQFVSDPVGIGLVVSLARSGRNVTGFSNLTTELTPERLELLTELVPQAHVIALLVNPANPYTEPMTQVAQEAARAKRVQLPILKAGAESEIDAAFAALVEMHAGGLLIGTEPFLYSRREQIVALAARYSVPTIYGARNESAVAGGLISYGINNAAVSRQTGNYAGRILKGVKPADLPVQQPTTFELVVNLNTA